jgi:hypothetical protein
MIPAFSVVTVLTSPEIQFQFHSFSVYPVEKIAIY